MADNAAPELLMSFEGAEFDEEENVVSFLAGAPLSWTVSTGCLGWLYWLYLRGAYLFCGKLYLLFDDADLREADMKLYMCKQNCCPWPMCMWWTMEQIDENTWYRGITFYCTSKQNKKASYTLKRIVDGQGNRLPAYDDMLESVRDGGVKIKGLIKKPEMQIMNGAEGGNQCCGLWGKETYGVEDYSDNDNG